MYEQIPVEVLESYEGKWIVWDQDEKKVVGCGETIDEAEDEAARAREITCCEFIMYCHAIGKLQGCYNACLARLEATDSSGFPAFVVVG